MRRISHPFIVVVILFSVYTAAPCYSQNILASFKHTISATLEQTLAPQSVDLDKLTQAPDSMLSLVEMKDGKKLPIAAQIEKKGRRFLHWMVVADEAGVIMMSHPGNYNYPEPLRIWPENQNGGKTQIPKHPSLLLQNNKSI